MIQIINEPSHIYSDEAIAGIFKKIIVNATEGNLMNISQGVYRKTQGRLFVAKNDSDEIILLVGGSMVDKSFLDVKHYWIGDIKSDILRESLDQIKTICGVNTLKFELRDDDKKAFEYAGIKVTLRLDELLDQEFYVASY